MDLTMISIDLGLTATNGTEGPDERDEKRRVATNGLALIRAHGSAGTQREATGMQREATGSYLMLSKSV